MIIAKELLIMLSYVTPSKMLSRFTIIRVMGMLMNPRVTFSMAANAANISTSSAIRIFDLNEALMNTILSKSFLGY